MSAVPRSGPKAFGTGLGATADYNSLTCNQCRHRRSRIVRTAQELAVVNLSNPDRFLGTTEQGEAHVCLTASCPRYTDLAKTPSWRIAP